MDGRARWSEPSRKRCGEQPLFAVRPFTLAFALVVWQLRQQVHIDRLFLNLARIRSIRRASCAD